MDFKEHLIKQLNDARIVRDSSIYGSLMYFYYDGKVVAFENALRSYELLNS